jgi:hypothetical protein
MFCQVFRNKSRLDSVARGKYLYIGKGAHPGKIVQGGMRPTQRPVAYPGGYPYYFYICLVIRNINFYLFITPRRQKTSRACHKNFFADRSQACGNADRVLLGDPGFNKPMGIFFRKSGGCDAAAGIRAYHKQGFIMFGKRLKC